MSVSTKKPETVGNTVQALLCSHSCSECISSLRLRLPDQPEQACFSRKLSRCATSEQKTFNVQFALLQLSFPKNVAVMGWHACTHTR